MSSRLDGEAVSPRAGAEQPGSDSGPFMITAALVRLRNRLLEWVVRRLGIPAEAVRQFRGLANTGRRAEASVPTENLPLAMNVLSQGVFNYMLFQTEFYWVWPWWVRRQLDPRDEAFVPRALQMIMVNITFRNWTTVGTALRRSGAVIDPAGMLNPYFRSYGIDFHLSEGGETFFPSRQPKPRQSIESGFPCVTTEFDWRGLRITRTTWGARAGGHPVVVDELTVHNGGDDVRSGVSWCAIRPFDPEGVSPVFELRFEFPGAFEIEGTQGPVFDRYPEHLLLSTHADGDVALQLAPVFRQTGARCQAGLAQAAAGVSWSLRPGESSTWRWLTPVERKPAGLETVYALRSGLPSRETARETWAAETSAFATLETTSPFWGMAFQRARNALLLRIQGAEVTPGPYTYDRFWFRDAAYQLTALDALGCHREVREVLRFFPMRQDVDGFFRSQNGEWDSNGQAIWTVMRHHAMTGETALLAELYPSLVRGVSWIEGKRLVDSDPVAPHAGLLPPGLSAEHLGHVDYYYWDNFWALAGILQFARAAKLLGRSAEEHRALATARSLRNAIEQSLRGVEERLGTAIIPAGPYRRLDCGAIGTAAALYPLGLIGADDPRLWNTLDALEREHFSDGMFRQDIFHSGWNAYLTLQVAQCHLLAGNAKALDMFHAVMGKATSTGTFPEAIHPRTGGGAMGDGHHAWADAEVVHFIRGLIVREEEDILVLFPLPVPEWFKAGHVLHARNLATGFGTISVTLTATADSVELDLATEYHRVPREVVVCLPPKGFKRAQAARSEASMRRGGTPSVSISPAEEKVVFRR